MRIPFNANWVYTSSVTKKANRCRKKKEKRSFRRDQCSVTNPNTTTYLETQLDRLRVVQKTDIAGVLRLKIAFRTPFAEHFVTLLSPRAEVCGF